MLDERFGSAVALWVCSRRSACGSGRRPRLFSRDFGETIGTAAGSSSCGYSFDDSAFRYVTHNTSLSSHSSAASYPEIGSIVELAPISTSDPIRTDPETHACGFRRE